MTARKRKYPKQVYLTLEEPEDGDAWLEVHEEPDEAAEVGVSVEVAVYEFVRTAKVQTTTKIV